MTLNDIAFLILAFLLFAALGGLALRVTGLVLALGSLTWLAFGWDNYDQALKQIAIGGGLWLLGHLHFVIKHHYYLNTHAGRIIFGLTPRPLKPRIPRPPGRDIPC